MEFRPSERATSLAGRGTNFDPKPAESLHKGAQDSMMQLTCKYIENPYACK